MKYINNRPNNTTEVSIICCLLCQFGAELVILSPELDVEIAEEPDFSNLPTILIENKDIQL